MFCTHCGAKIGDGANFCEYCGSPVQQPSVQIPVQKVEQKDTFYVRKLPMVMIVFLTLGLLLASFTMGAGSMTFAMLISCAQGIILIVLIYRLDRIESEPVNLLVKLFCMGAFLLPIVAIIVELVLELVVNTVFAEGSVLNSIASAFIVAALTEEMCKYFVLKKLTWNHPAFNYRFDGVVYSTTVAIGFEVVENLLYLIGSTADTAFLRSAFPGHCIFGIYMGYYYGQAKSLEKNGDIEGSAKMRRKGITNAIIIHGIYDSVCMLGSGNDLLIFVSFIALIVIMCALNVSAYKNIKKFAHEDKPV